MRILALCLISLFIVSCSKTSELEKKIKCKSIKLDNVVDKTDFNKNFTLTIPISWKTDLYFDKNTSEIFTADTTKQLSETYILGASYNFGTLSFNSKFKKETDSILKLTTLKIIDSGQVSFQNKLAYYYIAQGTRNDLTYHKFNISVLLTENTYFNAYSEIFGNEKVEERICESVGLIEGVQFLQ